MSIIKKIALTNFRIFKERTEFELAPITIVTGANNSGKSTFIKAIKLLVESATASGFLYLLKSKTDTGYRSSNDLLDVNVEGGNTIIELYLDLAFSLNHYNNSINSAESFIGNNSKVIFTYCKPNYGKMFNTKFTDNYGEFLKLSDMKVYSEENALLFNFYEKIDLVLDSQGMEHCSHIHYFEFGVESYLGLRFDLVVKKNKIDELFQRFHWNENRIDEVLLFLRSSFSKNNKFFHTNIKNEEGESPYIQQSLKDWLKIGFDKIYSQPASSTGYITHIFIRKFISKFEADLNADDFKHLIECLIAIYEDLQFNFVNFNNQLVENIGGQLSKYDHYISANNRGSVLREISPDDNNLLSEKVFKILHSKDRENEYTNIHGLNNSIYKFEFVNTVIRDIFFMGSGIEFKYNNSKEKYEINLVEMVSEEIKDNLFRDKDWSGFAKYYNSLNRTNIADLGSGVYHLLIFLIEIELAIVDGNYNALSLVYPEHSKLILADHAILIEEPEISLHPNFQSKLADVFCLAQDKYGVSFIVETHSEYLIRKLQYKVAKKEIESENILIFYMDKNVGGANISKININKEGSLSEPFGEGFYDEATNLQFDLLKIKNTQMN